MLIEDAQFTVKNTNENFVYPQFEKYCISNIPSTILELFNIQNGKTSLTENSIKNIDNGKINKIVLLVVDGFGFNQFLKYHKQNRFLTALENRGEVFPLTSVFPSQTTNALTTLSTGLTPQEHGLFEYFIYLKDAGIVNALRFELIDSKHQSKVMEKKFDPGDMFRGKTINNILKKEGVSSFTHMNISNAYDACSKLIFEGSTMVPSLESSDSIVKLRKNLEKNRNGGYFFVHLNTLDTISHEYGPQSFEYYAELSSMLFLIKKELIEKINNETAKETLILITSDHGAIDVDPKETTYINLFPKFILNLDCGRDKKRILPVGSPRDIFLHIKEKNLIETKRVLLQKLGKKAQIIEAKNAIKNGLFGQGKANQAFLDRIGNLLIIPNGKETIWFEKPEGIKVNFLGQHGGLNKEEMFVPFSIAKLSDLKKEF